MKMRLIDLTGQKFGKLTVIQKTKSKNKRTMWLCKCECGNKKIIGGNELKNGITKSCGCYNLQKLHERKKHGMCNTRLYSIWKCMKYRCYGEKYQETSYYKDKGIKVCDEWLDFNNFYEWAKDKYFDESSIDRIDSNGNYEPNNCRFVDKYVQANNKSNNITIEYKGEAKTLAQWAKEKNINYFSLRNRYLKGWDVERMLNEKSIKGKNQFYKSKESN